MVDIDTFQGRVAVMIVARHERRAGRLTRGQLGTIREGLRNPEAAEAVAGALVDAAEAMGAKVRTFQDWVQWLMDNWEQILQVILTILALL